jgi:hypothetical protein
VPVPSAEGKYRCTAFVRTGRASSCTRASSRRHLTARAHAVQHFTETTSDQYGCSTRLPSQAQTEQQGGGSISVFGGPTLFVLSGIVDEGSPLRL